MGKRNLLNRIKGGEKEEGIRKKVGEVWGIVKIECLFYLGVIVFFSW